MSNIIITKWMCIKMKIIYMEIIRIKVRDEMGDNGNEN
jgi:hypothetical protein